MNLWCLEFVSPSFHTGPGNCDSHQPFWKWQGLCKECGKLRQGVQGLFCSNFVHQHRVWAPCQQMWCGACYKDLEFHSFHIEEPENGKGVVWKKSCDVGRYMKGRNGDMLLNPFQCDLCWLGT